MKIKRRLQLIKEAMVPRDETSHSILASLRKAFWFLHSPACRAFLMNGIIFLSWPLLRYPAGIYRTIACRKTRVIAVVGSLGKTTTMRAVTVTLGLPVHPKADFNAFSRVAFALFRIHPRQRHAVIEVGIARKGDMRRYADTIRPDITVVTSIASEHMTSLGNLGVTRSEKAEMVRALPCSGLAVLNGDDPNVLWMKECTSAHVTTYGLSDSNDVYATDVALIWPHGMCFNLHCRGSVRWVTMRLLGRVSVYAALAAVAVGVAENIPLDEVVRSFEGLSAGDRRLKPVRLDSGAWLLRDEYKSTVETIDAALDVLAEIPLRRKILVLGEISEPPGSQGPIYRRIGGRIAEVAHRAIFVGSQQSCDRYTVGAVTGGMDRNAITKAGNSLQRAIEAIPRDLGPGDIVLIKGRDNQKLARVSLSLMGRAVKCDLRVCMTGQILGCDSCGMLEKGLGELSQKEGLS